MSPVVIDAKELNASTAEVSLSNSNYYLCCIKGLLLNCERLEKERNYVADSLTQLYLGITITVFPFIGVGKAT